MITLAERLPLPDTILQYGIHHLVRATSTRLANAPADMNQAFIRACAHLPIATHVAEANAQHYELPPAFFERVLGPHQKYSCCLFDNAADTLQQAEENALEATCLHADIQDGQSILELGCGWGSLSLWLAEHYPAANILAVSNSAPQRAHIQAQAARRALHNLRIVTADMNDFDPHTQFDRIVSVEMFEHISNWPALLNRVQGWLRPQARLFVHVFTHGTTPYRFDHTNAADWIARYFFTGGIMPSHALLGQASPHFQVEAEWRWNGRHYQRTALAWLRNFDAHEPEITTVLRGVYGAEAPVWRRRWRLFFLATAGLFGFQEGQEWGVSHYRLKQR
jgi:cyclopropane-fatty-acyl-phospholipid synthase